MDMHQTIMSFRRFLQSSPLRKYLNFLVPVCCIVCVLLYIYGWSDTNNIDVLSVQSIRRSILKKPFSDVSGTKHDVILSAYMNSGSRYTGQLLGFLNSSFFFYEPLWRFSIWDYFRPPNIQCSSTVGVCRHIRTEDVNTYRPDQRTNVPETVLENLPSGASPVEMMLYVLSSILRCDLVPLKKLIQERVHDLPGYAGPSWRKYGECLLKFNPKSQCLSDLERLCKEKTHRVVKVLRLTTGTFRPLLETNPRLKIIHLVRDPRAIIHSRLYSRFYPAINFRGNDSLERNLCDKMLTDILEIKELQKDFPGRVRVIYYEDFSNNQNERLKQLYKFLRMKYNESEVKTISQVKINLAPPDKGNNFARDRKDHNAIWWREYMKWENIKHMDEICYKVYAELGYKTLSESKVRDLASSNLDVPPSLKLTSNTTLSSV